MQDEKPANENAEKNPVPLPEPASAAPVATAPEQTLTPERKKPGAPKGPRKMRITDPVGESIPIVKRRKDVREIKDVHSAIKDRAEEMNDLIRAHNKEYPKDQWAEIKVGPASEVAPAITADGFASVYKLGITMALMGAGFPEDAVKDALDSYNKAIADYAKDVAAVAAKFPGMTNRWVELVFVAGHGVGLTLTIAQSAAGRAEKMIAAKGQVDGRSA